MKNHSRHLHSPLCTLKGMIRIILPQFSQCSPLYHALWVHLLNWGKILHIMPFRVQTVKPIIPFGYICQKAFFKHALSVQHIISFGHISRKACFRHAQEAGKNILILLLKFVCIIILMYHVIKVFIIQLTGFIYGGQK